MSHRLVKTKQDVKLPKGYLSRLLIAEEENPRNPSIFTVVAWLTPTGKTIAIEPPATMVLPAADINSIEPHTLQA